MLESGVIFLPKTVGHQWEAYTDWFSTAWYSRSPRPNRKWAGHEIYSECSAM